MSDSTKHPNVSSNSKPEVRNTPSVISKQPATSAQAKLMGCTN
ncbi:hypothetical protein [Lactiplantibacillus plantarum]|nr:hypothetical protein [Lactiplantibacillus plantarum]